MLASKYDPTVQRGGTFQIVVTAVDANGSPEDFSSYDSMRLHVRPAWTGKPGSIKKVTPLLTLSTATGEIVVATTTITITISAAVTAALEFNSGNYELEMVKDVDLVGPPVIPDEVVDKLLYGTMHITGEIVV